MPYLIIAGQIIFLSMAVLLIQRGNYGPAASMLILIPGIPFANYRQNSVVMYISWLCLLVAGAAFVMTLSNNSR
jgi:hypothetical protein